MPAKRIKITENTITGILLGLNWQGHIELPDIDIRWLAREISNAINNNRQGRCHNCGNQALLMVKVPMGDICETCVEAIGRMTDEIREEYENR